MLTESVALVTGSTKGIGKAIAKILSNAGMVVVIHSKESREEGEQLVKDLPNAIYLSADIRDQNQCQQLIDKIKEQCHRLDILVNNAGISKRIPAGDMAAVSIDHFQDILNTNVIAPWFLSRYAMPYLKQSPNGAIINISSVAGIRAIGSSIPYSVSKAALNHLSRHLAKIAAPEVTVNTIAPGFVTTERTVQWHDIEQQFTENSLLQRAATPEEIANMVLQVIKSRFMTGEILIADGGIAIV